MGTEPDFQVVNGHKCEFVPVSEPAQVWCAHHGAVVVDDFGDHRHGFEPGQARKFDPGFRVPVAFAHPAGLGNEREHVAGAGEVRGRGTRAGQQVRGVGAVGGTDAGRNPRGRVAGDRVRGAFGVLVVGHHGVQVQFRCPFRQHGDANNARGVPHHEPHPVWCDGVGGHDEVAFVFAVLIVDHHDGAATFEFGDREVD